MSVGSILFTGLQAMQSGINRANMAGAQIAANGVEDENLAKNMIDLKQGEFAVKAAANIIKTGDALIDMRA